MFYGSFIVELLLLGMFWGLTRYTQIISNDSWSFSRYDISWKFMSMLCMTGASFAILAGWTMGVNWWIAGGACLIGVSCFKSYLKNKTRGLFHYCFAGLTALFAIIGACQLHAIWAVALWAILSFIFEYMVTKFVCDNKEGFMGIVGEFVASDILSIAYIVHMIYLLGLI